MGFLLFLSLLWESSSQVRQPSGSVATPKRPELVIQVGHAAGVLDFAWAEGGRVLATIGRSDTAVNLWDVNKGLVYRSCDLSAEGRPASVVIANGYAVVADDDGVLTEWSLDSCERGPSAELSNDRLVKPVRIVDSSLLLTGSGANLFLVRTDTMARASTISAARSTGAKLTAIAASDTSGLVASGMDDGDIALWSVAGSTLGVLDRVQAGEEIRSLEITADGILAVVGEGEIKFWQIKQNKFGSMTVIRPTRIKRLLGLVSARPDHDTVDFDATADDIEETDVVISWSITQHIEIARSKGEKPHRCPSICETAHIVGDVVEITLGKGLVKRLTGSVNPIRSIDFHPSVPILASGGQDGALYLWNLADGRVLKMPTQDTSEIRQVRFSPNGDLIVAGSISGRTSVWEWQQARLLANFLGNESVEALAFSEDSSHLAIGYSDTIRVWDISSDPRRSQTIQDVPMIGRSLRFRGDSLLTAGSEFVREWSFKGRPKLLRSSVVGTGAVCCVAFSNRGDLMAVSKEGIDSKVHLYETRTLREIPGLIVPTDNAVLSGLGFSMNDGLVFAAGSSSIYFWNEHASETTRVIDNPHRGTVGQLAVSSLNHFLASSSLTDTAKITDISSRSSFTIVGQNRGWIAVSDSDQTFDASNLEDLEGLNWVFEDSPRRALPAEIFMRDYYEPKLIPRLLSCRAAQITDSSACTKEFRKLRPLSSLDRTQPYISEPEMTTEQGNSGLVTVRVRVKSETSDTQKDQRGSLLQSGVYDVRLFRDGQLVGWAPRDSTAWQAQSNERGDEPDGVELAGWRQAHEVKSGQPEVERMEADGSLLVRFEHVPLPRRADQKEVVWKAYAFNVDRVKSATASKTAPLPRSLRPRSGVAYVISVGVNRTQSEHRDWELNYAANDARRLNAVVVDNLGKTKRGASKDFAYVAPIRLVSDAGPPQLRELPATQEYLRGVLDLLAGREPSAKLKAEILKVAPIGKAQPEDLVLLSVSSHGYTDQRGTFHFVLADVSAPQKVTDALNRQTLSSDQLSAWLREIDAGELVLVVDACQSETTIQTEGFKPGPMGSRGLGQLAYDKGMRVLAASKAKESAFELGTDAQGHKIEQGLLSYALVQEGLVQRQADRNHDGQITIGEWLRYAEQEVPRLFQEGASKGVVESKGASGATAHRYLGKRQGDVGADSGDTPARYQQPILFDFYKTQRETVIAGK